MADRPPTDADVVIAGAGLAGACAALTLSATATVLLLDAASPAAGASGVAAGLVNPLMARKAHLAWRADEALEALRHTIIHTSAHPHVRLTGVLRPAADAAQALDFQSAARIVPHHGRWLSAEAAQHTHPHVHAPEGALFVQTGGAVDVPAFVRAVVRAAEQQGATVIAGARVVGWSSRAEDLSVTVSAAGATHDVRAQRLLLCIGGGFQGFAPLRSLNLHAIKGQTVRIARPDGLPPNLPILAGRGYVVPEGDTLVVGSSYEHTFSDLQPSPEVSQQILRKASAMLPGLADAAVLDAAAGVRVTVPGTRLPMLGPLPGEPNAWIFTGLGSKGLLMAPLLARWLPRLLEQPDEIPPEIQVMAP